MSEITGRPTCAEVSLGGLRTNLRQARTCVGDQVRVLAVVKADGYGHGAVPAARAFLEAGAYGLGVSSVAEGVELRRAGLSADTVVLGGAYPGDESAVVLHDLAVGVWSRDQVCALAAAAETAGRIVRVHVKVDTGMTRLGLDLTEVRGFADFLQRLPTVQVDGLYSHFARADDVAVEAIDRQVARFEQAIDSLAAAGVRPVHLHIANSAATMARRGAHFTMVRPGIMLYGYAPADHLPGAGDLTPALRFRTAIAQVRHTPRDTPVGYGGQFVTRRSSLIATVPVGYADGFHRLTWTDGWVLVRGRRAKIAGRICMDHTMLDVTDVPGVTAGDEVVLVGAQQGERITADEVAGWGQTISYEVLTSVSKRVPRRYVEEFDGG
jgi:alanine racemase